MTSDTNIYFIAEYVLDYLIVSVCRNRSKLRNYENNNHKLSIVQDYNVNIANLILAVPLEIN